ncbi:MAG: ABC transporter permease [Candidatus Heimdallarchaeota archaeon]|nr:MAG: ABC transporter permease [Candidatus Heimdallarchaeota archaeon]
MRKVDVRWKKIFSHPSMNYVFKKSAFYLVAIIIALTFAFFVPRFMSSAERNIWVVYFFDLDKPLVEQYLIFWSNLIRLDLGPSFTYYPMTVIEVMFFPLIYTSLLVIPVLFLSFYVGNWIGGRAAYLKGRLNDLVYYILLCARSAPFYWLGIIIFVYFVTGDNIFLAHPGGISPGVSRGFTTEFFIDTLRHYAPAFLTLFIVNIGFWALGMRAMILYEMETSYINYARHSGFRNSTLRKYSQRNAILPQFTLLNMRLNELVGETLILENVLLWPGIGALYLDSILSRDYPLVTGITIVLLVIAIIGNFLIDVSYGLLDPRIRTGSKT